MKNKDIQSNMKYLRRAATWKTRRDGVIGIYIRNEVSKQNHSENRDRQNNKKKQ